MISLILLFVYSLIKFTWSVRQFNFVTIVIGSIAPRDALTDLDRRNARRAAGILKLAGRISTGACGRTTSRSHCCSGLCSRGSSSRRRRW